MQLNGQPIEASHDTVLQELESRGISVQAECRSGFCGACRTKAKGEAIYCQEPIGFCNNDEVLPCCLSTKSDIDILIID
ncbi:2Fe-2S iron-sulfur cluster-binding protein [Vibrio owensii]|uniref:2Fe-2S iron-sulfur cluster-binding protein n=1 Tax=Vibrio owensii TaxID=696485 RepID=UPI0040683100